MSFKSTVCKKEDYKTLLERGVTFPPENVYFLVNSNKRNGQNISGSLIKNYTFLEKKIGLQVNILWLVCGSIIYFYDLNFFFNFPILFYYFSRNSSSTTWTFLEWFPIFAFVTYTLVCAIIKQYLRFVGQTYHAFVFFV